MSLTIQSGILTLRDTHQKSIELKTHYAIRQNKDFHRCGNFYPALEHCTMFIDTLDPAIDILVVKDREDQLKLTYFELAQYARADGDALRARNP